jgi:uncharacterized membrane protein YebE (DUF533 family)
MNDLNKMINGLSKSGLFSGFAGGLAGGSLAGLMTSKKGRNMGKSALKIGALAAVGGVAWKAYQSYSQNNQQPSQLNATNFSNGHQPINYAPSTLAQDQFESVAQGSQDSNGQLLLLRAMISAANADGHIDAQEKQRIFEQVEHMSLSLADKASLFDELRRPLAVEQLVEQVPNAETGIEVYAASLLAIDQSQPASVRYLQSLANSLCLPRELISSLHAQTKQTEQPFLSVSV